MKANKFLFYVLFSVSLLIAACHASRLAPGDYIQWVENPDNNLKVTKTIADLDFTLQYKPLQYIALRENDSLAANKNAIAKRLQDLKGMQYYTLRIASTGIEKDILKTNLRNNNEYYSRLEYFSSIMQDDLSLIQGKDTLPCLLFHYERNYNLAPYTNFLLGFSEPLDKSANDRTLIFNDEVFGCGTIQLSVPGNAIANIPELKEE